MQSCVAANFDATEEGKLIDQSSMEAMVWVHLGFNHLQGALHDSCNMQLLVALTTV